MNPYVTGAIIGVVVGQTTPLGERIGQTKIGEGIQAGWGHFAANVIFGFMTLQDKLKRR